MAWYSLHSVLFCFFHSNIRKQLLNEVILNEKAWIDTRECTVTPELKLKLEEHFEFQQRTKDWKAQLMSVSVLLLLLAPLLIIPLILRGDLSVQRRVETNVL